VDTAKKIEASTARNAMRLKVLSARAQAMETVVEEARGETGGDERGRRTIPDADDGADRARARESSAMRACACDAASAMRRWRARRWRRRRRRCPGTTVTLDESSSLPAAPACSGGVEVANSTGKIVCDNTLDARLRIAYENGTPAIRAKIFGESSADASERERAAAHASTPNLIAL
jgi:V-type H+-transporting ATPase subunit E